MLRETPDYRIAGTTERVDYLSALIEQTQDWCNGVSKHNTISGECVLDFSCCRPSLGKNTTQTQRKSHLKKMEQLLMDEL